MSLTDIERIKNQECQPHSVALWRALQPLKSCISFMNTGAHPDDETSPMLAALGLRDGVKLSHACSTRGEGGQNALGLEVTKDLGVVRTREMERAAKVLDMTHYWLSETPDDSIFDFGFSKSGEETLGYWGKQRTLERFVQIIRRERPDIICPTFLDVSGQHGHHRAMTQSAFDAVKIAADPTAFPEQGLDTWHVKKLYLPAWSGAGDAYDDDEPPPMKTTSVDATGSDPVLGADYAQIAQWSRAYHATQQMGVWIEPGEKSIWPLNLAWSANGKTGEENNIFADLPRSFNELADYAGAPELSQTLINAQTAMDKAIDAWPDRAQIIAHAIRAIELIRTATKVCPSKAKEDILHRLQSKERALSRVLYLANDLSFRASLSQNSARPGEEINVIFHANAPEINLKTDLIVPDGWHVEKSATNSIKVRVSDDAEPSNPYPDTWYSDRANGEIYALLSWKQGAVEITISLDLEDNLQILPSYSAKLTPPASLYNLSAPRPVLLGVSGVSPQNAKTELQSCPGWETSQDESGFTLIPTPNAVSGAYEFTLSLDGSTAITIHKMDYPHTGPLVRTEPGIAKVRVLDVKIPTAKVAYIGGGSDRVDYWLRALGMKVTTLDDSNLAQSDFSEFDSILVGIFAFRTRPVLVQKLSRLHNWVREGGNLVTLYHRPWDNWNPEFMPLAPIKIGKPSLRWRVTNENAPVKYLVSDHPLLNTPNKITEEDWQHWQKERGLYFAAEWDQQYAPLLSMSDQGEAPLLGSLLSGKFGKGRHTHTSLILHYQLEKLVPGAYRILANLLN